MKDIKFKIVNYKGKQLYSNNLMNNKEINKKIVIEPKLKVQNEFRFELKSNLYLWQHSYFVSDREIYNKQQIDGICNNPNYSDDFNIEFIFKK